MSPEQLAKSGSEHSHQTALFCWASLPSTRVQFSHLYPYLDFMFAIPNGGERNAATAARLRAEGVKSGVSDIFLAKAQHPYNGLFIEMKKPKGKESAEQIKFGKHVSECGYRYAVCYTWEEARDVLIEYFAN